MRRPSCILLAVCFGLTLSCFAHHVQQSVAKTMPVSTASPKARDLYERAMTDYENYYLERANLEWRAATVADPDFALAYAWLAFNGRNPAEVSSALAKAQSLESKVTAGERLMIEWIVNVRQNHFVAGISAMNDMLAMFPRDKRLLYLAGNWMMGESSYEHAETLFERALTVDKNYPAPMNDLAYALAREREFDKALATMDRYAAALPGQPNPQDSYAELLRMSGKFQPALDHYRAALKIDPNFVSSQLGLGDTYALMGDEAQARIEYDKAIQLDSNDADRLDYEFQKAISYVRENDFSDADKTLLATADRAHAWGFHLQEAKAHRMIAMYASEDVAALKQIQSAEDALLHSNTIPASDREEERARIVRERVVRASHASDDRQAAQSLRQLEEMAGSTSSRNIQKSWHGAAGALLLNQKRYTDAIGHLEEDVDNPCTLALLARAYAGAASTEKLRQAEARLGATYVPTLEQALGTSSTRNLAAGN